MLIEDCMTAFSTEYQNNNLKTIELYPIPKKILFYIFSLTSF